MHFSPDRTAHITVFDRPVVYHRLEWKIAQTANASAIQDRSVMPEDPNLYSRVLYRLSYVLPPLCTDAILKHLLWHRLCTKDESFKINVPSSENE